MASFDNTKWDKQYLPSDDKEKTRTVGIEFECSVTNLNSKFHSRNINILRNEWIKEHPTGWFDAQKIVIDEKNFPIAGWGYDGGEKEFVTHPDSYNYFKRGGSKRFKQVVEYLAEHTEADVDSGTHIHISELKNEDKQKTWDNLYWCMCGFGLEMQKVFGRTSHWTTPPSLSKFVEGIYSYDIPNVFKLTYPKPKNMKKISTKITSEKHTMINLHRNGTYEFRGPKASHDLQEILAWVQFCHNMVEICANTDDITKVPFGEFIKGKYIAKYVREISKNQYRTITLKDRRRSIGSAVNFSYYNSNKVL